VMICITLTACDGQKSTPTVFPSITPEPRIIAIPTTTSIPTEIFPTQPLPTPTFTPFPPYQNKQVIFNYYVAGNQSGFDEFFAPESCCSLDTRIVLYDDGQMIIAGKQKVLSSDEIKGFLSQLETLGFYSIESNQQRDITDKLYNFGNNYQEVNDGLKYCVLVNAKKSRKLCAREDYMQYLIPKMKAIFKYLDEYEPAGMTPYYPDRILLEIRQADPDNDHNLPPAIPWDEHFPSFDLSNAKIYFWTTPSAIIYIHGDMAKKISLFFESTNYSSVYSQNGNEYIVEIYELLPHEKIINAYQ
jgi:hypothetical protein